MRTLLFLSLTVMNACVQCGEGTTLKDGACVAEDDEDTGADPGDTDTAGEDTDTAADTDTDTQVDSEDTGGDSGVDSDTGGDSDTGSGDTDTGEETDTSPSWTVCDDGVAPYDDLQDAVDDAADGDTIHVCAGVWDYVEISRAELSIAGEGADVTTIDGGSGHTAVSIDDSTVAISGMTLTGTTTTHGGIAALYAYDSVLTLTSMRVAGNESTSTSGTAVYLVQGGATLEDVVFEDNEVSGWALAVDYASLTMRHSIFRNNGGAPSRSEGGFLLAVSRADADVSNNLFHDNEVLGNASPVSLYPDGSDVWFYNNTVYGNAATSGEAFIYLYDGVVFENNVVHDTETRGISYQGSSSTVSYNLSFGHESYNFSDYTGITETGNLEQDPRLSDPESGDFTLDPGFSPCIDAGDPLNGYDDADGSRNDMGAFGGPSGSW